MTVNKQYVDWTSNSSGTATATVILNGVLLAVVFKPNTSTTQPTDNYDVVVTDPQGYDILSGLGANLSNSATTKKCPLIAATDGTTTTAVPGAVAGSHTVTVTNAGSAKTGTIVFYYR